MEENIDHQFNISGNKFTNISDLQTNYINSDDQLTKFIEKITNKLVVEDESEYILYLLKKKLPFVLQQQQKSQKNFLDFSIRP